MSTAEFQEQLLGIESYLNAFALKYTRDEDAAKDLTQETLFKALRYKDKFAPNTNFKAWIFTIMKNIFINQYRRKSKAKMIFDHTDNDYFINIKGQNTEDPSRNMDYKQIMKVVSELEEGYRVPFMMHYQGYKYKEISDEMHLPIGTVKSRIFLARKKLMNALQDFKYVQN